MVSKQLFFLVAALCTVMGRPAEMEGEKQPMATGPSQKGLSDPETDEVAMKNRMYQYSLGPPQGFIPVYYMMPPPPPPSSGGAKQRMRRPYQMEREQDRPLENRHPLMSSDSEQNKKMDDPASVVDPEPSLVELPAGHSSDVDQHQPELSSKDLEQLQSFSSLVQPPRAIPSKSKRSVRGYIDVDDYDGYDGYGGYGGYGRGYNPYGGYRGGYRGYYPYRGGYNDDVIDIDIQI